MENFNTKQVIINLLKNNSITGHITTDPCEYKKELQVQMCFDDIMMDDNNVAILYDTDDDTRAELTGAIKLPLDLIEEAHLTDDFLNCSYLYGQYNILVYFGADLDKEVLITFNMKDKSRSPYILDNDEALEFAYAVESITNLDYFVNKPVKINLSTMSRFSTYNVDGCCYGSPIFASMELKSFQYESKVIDLVPCVTITDKEDKNVKLVLNAIGCVSEVNIGDSADKRIFHLYSEVGLATIMDKGYIYPAER